MDASTSGDKVVEKAFKRAGLPEEGEEVKRRMIDWDLRKDCIKAGCRGCCARSLRATN